MKRHIGLLAVIVVAAFLAMAIIGGGCGGTVSQPNNPDPIVVPPGIDGALAVNGNKIRVIIQWPGMSRLIANNTRKIVVSITGPDISSPPSGTIEYPETTVELEAPAGPGRYIRFIEYDRDNTETKRSYIYLGSLTPGTPRTGLTFALLDERYGSNTTAGVAIRLILGTKSFLAAISTGDDRDLETTGTQNDAVDFFSFQLTDRRYVTVKLTDLEQVSLAVTTHRVQLSILSVDGETAVADGTPTGTDNVSTNPAKSSSATSLADVRVSARLPAGTYYVRVRPVDTADAAVVTGANKFLYHVLVSEETVTVGGSGS